MTTMAPAARARQSAFTLLELVIAMSIVSVLMGTLTGSLMLSARQMARGAAADRNSCAAREIADEMTAELAVAIGFTETAPNAVSFTVPDRDGDERPEVITYRWDQADPDPARWAIVRKINNGEWKVIADNVRHFDLTYLLRTANPPAE